MTIGIVLPDLPTYSETFINHKIKGLEESGFKVIIFAGQNSKEKTSHVVKTSYPVYKSGFVKQAIMFSVVLLTTFIRIPGRTLRLFSCERKDGKSFFKALKLVYINAHILPHKLDWLHFGFATMSINRENVAKVMNAKMGVSFRGYDINIYPLKNPGCYEKLWNNVNNVHTISGYLHGKAVAMGLSSSKPFTKITPAIDVNEFSFKIDAGAFKDPIKIFTVGRLNWIKDYETAISCMKILRDSGVNFIYNIAGTGKELERLRYAAYQCDLIDQIFFLGQAKHGRIKEMMQESDIYLQTSMQEGFCVSVLEAQASGLICVVSDADGLKENVVNGVTGFVVEKRNPLKFANKIIDVLKLSQEERMKIALAARQRVEKDFNIEDQKIKFQKFFQNE